MKLEIGPRESPHKLDPEWEHLDLCRWPHVEIVAPMQTIPRPDNYYDAIYTSHCWEHATRREAQDALKEWFRILKPNGELEIIVPNLLEVCREIIILNESGFLGKEKEIFDRLEMMLDWIYGGQGDGNDFHKIGYMPYTVQYYLKNHGFIIVDIKNMPTERGKWNLYIKAKKPNG